jgi:hypothetical protein
MEIQSVDIIRIIRRMRGASQSHLVEGSDGYLYVAKFMGNPQGSRTLINEWFAHQLFRQLGISTPPLRVLHLTQALSENLFFQWDDKHIAVEPGFHLGSQCPVNPTQKTIFDFLPNSVIYQVMNLHDFAKTLVLDQLLAQTDARQAIFVREESSQGACGLRAYMIDNGSTLGGNSWTLPNNLNPSRNLYLSQVVYSLCNLQAECAQVLHQIAAMQKEDLYRLGHGVPRVWFSKDDEADWTKLLDLLEVRKGQLPQLVLHQLKSLHLGQLEKPSKILPKNACRDRNLLKQERAFLPDRAVLPALC